MAAARAALDAWGGEPFPGLDAPHLGVARDHARERRLRLAEREVDALLRLGRAAEAVDAVGPLAAEHPVRESLHALHVEALHRAGRPRDAVEAYLSVRRALADELAVSPGVELRAAYQRVVDERSAAGSGGHRRPTMVGRESPLARILDALTDDGRIVVVDGEAGIGKSVLLATARHDAEAAGAQVVAGAWQEDRTPMAAWFEALGRPPEWSAREAPGPWLREQLGALAGDGPVLLTLDDAHRADSASLGVLTLLARSGVPAGAVVLIAARTPDAVAHPTWDEAFAELGRADQFVHIALDLLDADAITRVAAPRLAHLGARPASDLATLVADRSGGHPLHAAALLDVLAAQPDEGTALLAARRVPERLRAMLQQQVARLPAAARGALEALVVLAPIDLVGLAGVLERRPLDVADDLRPAVDAGFAVALPDRVVLRHDLMAEAVHDAVPAAHRTQMHHARLTRLDAGPDAVDPFVRLRHAVGAAALIPAADLARARLDAGIAAYGRRALAEALALLDAAASELGPDPMVEVYRGLVLGALGRLEESDDVLDPALDALLPVDGPDETAAALLVLAAVGDEPLGRSVIGDPRRLARLRRVEPLALPPGARFELLASVVREESLSGTARPDAVAEMRELADRDGVGVTTRARARALEARMLVEGRCPRAPPPRVAEDAYELAEGTGDPLLRLDATELLMTAALGAGEIEWARKLRRRWPRTPSAGTAAADLGREHGGVGADDGGGRPRRRGLGRPRRTLARAGAGCVRRGAGLRRAPDDQALAGGHGRPAGRPRGGCRRGGAVHPGVVGGRCGGGGARRRDSTRPQSTWWSSDGAGPRSPAAPSTVRGCRWLRPPRSASVTGTSLASCWRSCPPIRRPSSSSATARWSSGPATIFTGLASWTLGDVRSAREGFATAAALTTSLGWTPWADAACRLRRPSTTRARSSCPSDSPCRPDSCPQSSTAGQRRRGAAGFSTVGPGGADGRVSSARGSTATSSSSGPVSAGRWPRAGSPRAVSRSSSSSEAGATRISAGSPARRRTTGSGRPIADPSTSDRSAR